MRIRNLFRPFYIIGRAKNWIYERQNPDHPWFSPDAIRWLDQELHPEAALKGFEWGSGRSTLWLARRLAALTSIEHDQQWYLEVKAKLNAPEFAHVYLQHLPLEHPEPETYANDYPHLPAYCRAIETIDDASLDVVLVDGWYRSVCTREAMNKLKPGGILLIDNTDWNHPPHFHVPNHWHRVHRSRNVMTETSIWRKPQSNR